MKKKDLIKLAMIGIMSSACLVAQDTDELDQTISMSRRNCRGYRCRGHKNKCRAQRRGSDGYFGARSNNGSNKSSCRGSNGCRGSTKSNNGSEYYDENGYEDGSNGGGSCSGKSGYPGPNGCGGSKSEDLPNKDKNKTSNSKYRNGQCKDPKKCSKNSSIDQKNDLKKADKNVKKRYESSF